MKKTIVLAVLVLASVMGLTSCVDGNVGDILDSMPEIDVSSDASIDVSDTSEEDPPTQPGYTDMPVVTQVINITASRVAVAGTCTPGSTIRVSGVSVEAETYSDTGYFILEVELANSGRTLLECTAQADDLEESTIRYFYAQYMATVSERKDGNAVTIGKDGHLYLNRTLEDYYGDTVLTMTQLKAIKEQVNSTFDSIQNARLNSLLEAYRQEISNGQPLTPEQLEESEIYVKENLFVEVPYIFLMVPSYVTVYPEYLPDDITTQTNSTRYSQLVKALKETKATVIDMKEVFEAHKTDDYPLYGRNDSYWTEYGAYLAYEQLMDIIAVQFPTATPRPLSDFTVEEREILGGDMVGYLYLDRETIKEKTVTLEPKFDIKFKTNIYVSDTDRALSYTMNDDKVLSFNSRHTVDNQLGEAYPNALVIHDEWLAQMYTMLTERFNGVIYANGYRTGAEPLANQFIPRIVDINYTREELQPDYVVVLVSEPNLGVCFEIEE